ncbi:tyrosine-type recombinase/integrase [Epilithonimonas hungarica]|uniref:Site-specific recombinase XerD n=1 Tax=Epilithonimonas hungarica TaxID=454006 RepID=A0A1G7IBF1_9FLAO|nr:phage integrase SAM-like domain-containing protein [Epilithonimonas hungarica]SDF09804.1 Site-specific recombinase XerD [Epilithonimonas hungarica]
MTFDFFLPQNGTLKNIHLSLTDKQQKKTHIFRTPLRICEEDWDKEKQRPTNIYLKKYKKLNNKLNKVKLGLTESIKEKRGCKKLLLQRALAKEIKKICSEKNNRPAENSLLYFMNWYIDSRKELICHSTYKRYKVFFHLLERFEGFICKRLYIEDINSDFIKDFMVFGREEEYSENTIYRTIHFVKTILNFVERKGVRTAVRELEIRREKQQKEIVTLTEKDITRIKSTDVPKELQAAKDWLLISCYTGQRFSDFIHFKTNQLKQVNGKTCIAFTQKKTQKDILLPLHPTVINTFHRNGDAFPKAMDIHHYNDGIKKIARLAYLNEPVKARKRIGHRAKDIQTEKWKLISSHIGRRSFATNFYGKIPTPLLMEATGHSTEQMFLKYINPVNDERVLSLGNYFERMYEERLRTC